MWTLRSLATETGVISFPKSEIDTGGNFSSCHPPGAKKGFVKGEALRLLRTNSSKTTFEENIYKFKSRLFARGYPKRLIETLLSDIKFTERESVLKQKN